MKTTLERAAFEVLFLEAEKSVSGNVIISMSDSRHLELDHDDFNVKAVVELNNRGVNGTWRDGTNSGGDGPIVVTAKKTKKVSDKGKSRLQLGSVFRRDGHLLIIDASFDKKPVNITLKGNFDPIESDDFMNGEQKAFKKTVHADITFSGKDLSVFGF